MLLLHLGDVATRPLWRAEKGEAFSAEASLAPGQPVIFHGQDWCLQRARHVIEARWRLIPEPLHDHGLADTAVAVDHD